MVLGLHPDEPVPLGDDGHIDGTADRLQVKRDPPFERCETNHGFCCDGEVLLPQFGNGFYDWICEAFGAIY